VEGHGDRILGFRTQVSGRRSQVSVLSKTGWWRGGRPRPSGDTGVARQVPCFGGSVCESNLPRNVVTTTYTARLALKIDISTW
jgi:hypothetical protein